MLHPLLTFGKKIPGLKIYGEDAPYAVMNEREVRAIAGIMLALGVTAFSLAFLTNNYQLLDIVVVIFFADFLWRVLFGTRLSPIAFVARLLIHGQHPDWVGATQKRFAWSLGVLLAGTMTVLIHGFGIRGPINLTLCSICLLFMWLESTMGVCVGCKMYNGLISVGVIKQPEHKPACPGGACSIKKPE